MRCLIKKRLLRIYSHKFIIKMWFILKVILTLGFTRSQPKKSEPHDVIYVLKTNIRPIMEMRVVKFKML